MQRGTPLKRPPIPFAHEHITGRQRKRLRDAKRRVGLQELAGTLDGIAVRQAAADEQREDRGHAGCWALSNRVSLAHLSERSGR
jgi:hypothetical protein